MKKFNDTTFEIETTTMRELNSNEIDSVGGGTHTSVIVTTVIASIAFSCFDSCEGENSQE